MADKTGSRRGEGLSWLLPCTRYRPMPNVVTRYDSLICNGGPFADWDKGSFTLASWLVSRPYLGLIPDRPRMMPLMREKWTGVVGPGHCRPGQGDPACPLVGFGGVLPVSQTTEGTVTLTLSLYGTAVREPPMGVHAPCIRGSPGGFPHAGCGYCFILSVLFV